MKKNIFTGRIIVDVSFQYGINKKNNYTKQAWGLILFLFNFALRRVTFCNQKVTKKFWGGQCAIANNTSYVLAMTLSDHPKPDDMNDRQIFQYLLFSQAELLRM